MQLVGTVYHIAFVSDEGITRLHDDCAANDLDDYGFASGSGSGGSKEGMHAAVEMTVESKNRLKSNIRQLGLIGSNVALGRVEVFVACVE